MVAGTPNVVTLVDEWDILYDGEPDSTSRIRQHHGGSLPQAVDYCHNRCHQQILMTSSDKRAKPVKKDKETRPPHIGDPNSESPNDSSDSSDSESSDFGSDFLAIEPESDHDSDSASVKRVKHAARRKYRAKMAKLKYQQGFLKHEPPFIYQGEPNAGTIFKKWVHEVWDWKSRARLTTTQGLCMLGKHLGGPAYKFFERDVLDLRKKYSLTEFFEHLFDYIFPPDF
jgi:hypothetical protein